LSCTVAWRPRAFPDGLVFGLTRRTASQRVVSLDKGPFPRFPFQGGEHFLDLLPAFRGHRPASLFIISRFSQVRAVAHSRFTVAGEMSSTSAVSSMESPPKNR